MPKPFFNRLREYYLRVGEVLRGEAEAASIFPNSTDVGMSREKVYAQFLKQHLPSKCNIFNGGFLFDEEGNESSQMDIIITTDTAPKFDFHNSDESGKSFCPVEGSIGIASIKSFLDKNQLHEALTGIASIPNMQPLGEDRLSFTVQVNNYEDFPYKILYASDGLEANTIYSHLINFYKANPDIPNHRKPNIIHVAGKYLILRADKGMMLKSKSTGEIKEIEKGQFTLSTAEPDLSGIIWTINSIQQNATASSEILYSYGWIINKVQGI